MFTGGFTGVVDKLEKTVVVTGVPQQAEERALFRHFAKCGPLLDIRVVRNKHDVPTGTVIVEYAEEDSVNRACSLQPPHSDFMGVPVVFKRADAQLTKKSAQKSIMTRSQLTQQVLSGLKAGGSSESGPNMRKLHIKNLRPVVTEEDMRGIFKPFGDFAAVKMGQNECWITFETHNDAQDAMGSMQGFQLVGQELQITLQAAEPSFSVPAVPPPPMRERIDTKHDSDFGATGTMAGMGNRLELMKKLAGAHSSTGVPMVVAAAGSGPHQLTNLLPPPPPGVPPPPAVPTPPSQAPPPYTLGGPTSRTLLLTGMFEPTTVNLAQEPKFYEEIREDTHEECQKFGKVLHVTVDPRGSEGRIYVLYENPGQRQAAEAALNGRWFEGRKILAIGIEDSIWQALAAQSAPGAR